MNELKLVIFLCFMFTFNYFMRDIYLTLSLILTFVAYIVILIKLRVEKHK